MVTKQELEDAFNKKTALEKEARKIGEKLITDLLEYHGLVSGVTRVVDTGNFSRKGEYIFHKMSGLPWTGGGHFDADKDRPAIYAFKIRKDGTKGERSFYLGYGWAKC